MSFEQGITGVSEYPASMEQEARDKCGVVGVYAASSETPVADLTLVALGRIQHRGYDAAGIAIVGENGTFACYKAEGHVNAIFPDGAGALDRRAPTAHIGVGHVRYSTVEGLTPEENQLAIMPCRSRNISLSHNGNVTNTYEIAVEYGVDPVDSPDDFVTDSTGITAAVGALYETGRSLSAAASEILPKLQGSYALAMTDGVELVVARDPFGIKPLSLGRLPDGGIIAISETVGLDATGATWIRDIEPGEILSISQKGMYSARMRGAERAEPAFCALEVPYLMDPKSKIGSSRMTVEQLRYYNLGYALADEHPMDDPDRYTVVGVPASGVPAARGYAEALGMEYADLITKRGGTGKSFLAPTQGARLTNIGHKLILDDARIEGRDLVVGDDSAIRGNTAKVLNARLRAAGATSIHMRIPFPMVMENCHLGVTMSKKSELLSTGRNLDEMAYQVGADSIRFISLGGFNRALAPAIGRMCTGCLGGTFATAPPQVHRDMLPLISVR